MTHPRLLVTAGPTQEPIDEVRYVSNRSSGRLGIAIAAEARRRGWPVTLLLGPIGSLDARSVAALGEDPVRFLTAADLARLLAERWPTHDLLIMAAAVADWRPTTPIAGKLRRESGMPPRIDLEAVPDLVAGLAESTRRDQVIVGFALEPADGLLESALAKLRRKRLDAIVANPLGTMDAATIEPTLIAADGSTTTPTPRCLEKSDFAVWLLDRCVELIAVRSTAGRSHSGASDGPAP